MSDEPIWVVGATRSGKTAFLVSQFRAWMESELSGLGHLTRDPGRDPGAQRSASTSTPTKAAATPVAASLPVSLIPPADESVPGVLVLAAIGDNRIDLLDRLTIATQGKVSLHSTTPLGFFQEEVMLFWSLLIQQLDLKAQFPIRLAPENEQELAAQLWRADLDRAIGQHTIAHSKQLGNKRSGSTRSGSRQALLKDG